MSWRECRAVRLSPETSSLLYHEVPRAARGVGRAANQRGSAAEPRLPRLCQALRQCYCHEGEGVIKTERPAVLSSRALIVFLLCITRERTARRQFAHASWASFSLLRFFDRISDSAWRPLTPVQHRQSFLSLLGLGTPTAQSSSARRSAVLGKSGALGLRLCIRGQTPPGHLTDHQTTKLPSSEPRRHPDPSPRKPRDSQPCRAFHPLSRLQRRRRQPKPLTMPPLRLRPRRPRPLRDPRPTAPPPRHRRVRRRARRPAQGTRTISPAAGATARSRLPRPMLSM